MSFGKKWSHILLKLLPTKCVAGRVSLMKWMLHVWGVAEYDLTLRLLIHVCKGKSIR